MTTETDNERSGDDVPVPAVRLGMGDAPRPGADGVSTVQELPVERAPEAKGSPGEGDAEGEASVVKPGAVDCLKMRALAARLREVDADRSWPAQAIGHMSALWAWAWTKTDDGDMTTFEAQDIAAAAKWRGDPDAFVGILVEVGFMDRVRGRLQLHDANEHAPNFVKDRIRQRERRSLDSSCDSSTDASEDLSEDMSRDTRKRKRKLELDRTGGSNTGGGETPRAREAAERILEALSLGSGRKFQAVDATLAPILARLKEGATEDECLAVIRGRLARWKGTDQEQYLRPSTLFIPKHFAEYLADCEAKPKAHAGTLSLGKASTQPDSGPCANDIPAPCGHAHAEHTRRPSGAMACGLCGCEWYTAPTVREIADLAGEP